jgi:hypothetical protein
MGLFSGNGFGPGLQGRRARNFWRAQGVYASEDAGRVRSPLRPLRCLLTGRCLPSHPARPVPVCVFICPPGRIGWARGIARRPAPLAQQRASWWQPGESLLLGRTRSFLSLHPSRPALRFRSSSVSAIPSPDGGLRGIGVIRTSHLRRSLKFAAHGSPLWPEGGWHGILAPSRPITGDETPKKRRVRSRERKGRHA